MQETRNLIANALELRISCTNRSIYHFSNVRGIIGEIHNTLHNRLWRHHQKVNMVKNFVKIVFDFPLPNDDVVYEIR